MFLAADWFNLKFMGNLALAHDIIVPDTRHPLTGTTDLILPEESFSPTVGPVYRKRFGVRDLWKIHRVKRYASAFPLRTR